VGEQAAEEDVYTSARIAFIILVLGICILLVHYIILKKLHHVPESVSVVFLGAVIGLIGKILKK
jgi:solute carrier family 9 (sodium/hydrogen exchanger), member 8